MIRHITFDAMELDGEACFGNIKGRNLDNSGMIHDESFRVDDLDLNLDLNVDLNVPLLEMFEGSSVQEVQYDVDGIKSGYDIQYDGDYSSEDAGTDDENDVMVDEENEIIEHDVEVNLFGITNNVPFDNIGVTSLLPKEVLEKEDVDVVNVDGFDSDEGCEDEVGFKRRKKLKEPIRGMENRVLNGTARMKYTFYCRHICGNAKEVKERVYLHSIESKRNWKQIRNDKSRVREICVGKMSVFTQSICSGLTGPSKAVGVGPNGSRGPNTRNKKGRGHVTLMTVKEVHMVNPDIPVKGVQDQLQRNLEMHVSLSKAFRAKAKVERNVIGDHTLGFGIAGIIGQTKDIYSGMSEAGQPETTIEEYLTKGQCIDELKENMFFGSENEDPHEHISNIRDIVNLFHSPGVSRDQVMLMAFPFTLKGRARQGSITTWDLFKNAFLRKYRLPSQIIKQINAIRNFKQEPNEPLHLAWERFNGSLYNCPERTINEHEQLQIFYQGLDTETRRNVDFKGPIPRMTPAAGTKAIIELSKHSLSWGRGNEASKITLNEQCLAVVLNEIPFKEKDLESFTKPCVIGQSRINKALADLGASISLMPYSMFLRLNLGELKPTRMCIELANKSTQIPKGIAENVIVKIDRFVFLVDFVVLDIKEDHKIPIILGRPFLATAHAMIDVFNKKISFEVGNETPSTLKNS
ncbi:hypothetical protein Tco_0596131 [Tanacetum coccineum]